MRNHAGLWCTVASKYTTAGLGNVGLSLLSWPIASLVEAMGDSGLVVLRQTGQPQGPTLSGIPLKEAGYG